MTRKAVRAAADSDALAVLLGRKGYVVTEPALQPILQSSLRQGSACLSICFLNKTRHASLYVFSPRLGMPRFVIRLLGLDTLRLPRPTA